MSDEEISLARGEATAAKWTAVLVALRANHDGSVDLDKLQELVQLTSGYLWMQGDRDAADALTRVAPFIRSFTNRGDWDPNHVMAAILAQFLDAGPDRAAALQEWLRAGTVEEIATDLRDTLERWRQSPPGSGEDPE